MKDKNNSNIPPFTEGRRPRAGNFSHCFSPSFLYWWEPPVMQCVLCILHCASWIVYFVLCIIPRPGHWHRGNICQCALCIVHCVFCSLPLVQKGRPDCPREAAERWRWRRWRRWRRAAPRPLTPRPCPPWSMANWRNREWQNYINLSNGKLEK